MTIFYLQNQEGANQIHKRLPQTVCLATKKYLEQNMNQCFNMKASLKMQTI